MVAVTTRGEAARAALVSAAERLFAERGIEGVSLRDVCAEAGQRNHNAAQYHFGDRQGLVDAVYVFNTSRVDEARRAQLERTEPTDVRGLVAVLVEPLVDHVAHAEGWYARFLWRLRFEREEVDDDGNLKISPAGSKAVRLLGACLSHLPAAVRRHRLDQLLTMGIGTLAGWEGAPARGEKRLPADAVARDLVTTGTAMLVAPYES